MSDDLISRSQTKEAIYAYIDKHRHSKNDEISWTGLDWLLKDSAVIDIIDSQPVACDIDDIVRDLENRKELLKFANISRSAKEAAEQAYLFAISTVREGGVNE